MADVNGKTSQTFDNNLETFSLFWLDEQVNTTEDNLITQQKLREIINHLITFDNQYECHQQILSLSSEDRLVLIISGRCGRQLVPQIHHLRQISSIYIYCIDKLGHEQWAKDFVKVKSVIVLLDDLVYVIQADQRCPVKTEEPITINVFNANSNPDKSTTELNGHFVHSILLIDILTRMKSIESDKRELIQLCQNEYQNNQMQLALVHEFANTYTADQVLWWYSRDSFLYRILNKALRVQNINLLFLLRFVIGDMYRQLKQHQYQSSIRVYRGQVISNNELNTLSHSIGNLISINSFFSTSTNHYKALDFLSSSEISNDLHRILFIIDADPSAAKTKPFADISSFSDYKEECEVLFMTGCVFRLIQVEQNHYDQIWVIHMQLCNDDEHELKKLVDFLENECGDSNNEQCDFLLFGKTLHRMGKYDLAEKMYNRLLKELTPNHPLLGNLYFVLGTVNKDKANYDASLQWFRDSLQIYEQKGLSNYVMICDIYNVIGIVYGKKGDSTKALEYFFKAIALFQQMNDGNHPHMGCIYNSVSHIYHDQKKYEEALDTLQKSLAIQKQNLPSDHPHIASGYYNMSGLYLIMGQYDLCMEYNEKALEIRLKSLPSDHSDIAMSYENIARVYEIKNQWEEALKFYEKAFSIYQQSLSLQHPDTIRVKQNIQRLSSYLQ